MLIVLHTSVTILGLEPLSAVLDKLLNYLPNIISAILVLFIGTLLAGVVESVVKGSIKTIDGKSSRFLGKIASYLVVSLTIMAAISELGIASEFITIIFIGFIAMLSVGVGLAVGLGGQDVVRKVLNTWYDRTVAEVKE
jgi:small-conductance mechanosensitive channel